MTTPPDSAALASATERPMTGLLARCRRVLVRAPRETARTDGDGQAVAPGTVARVRPEARAEAAPELRAAEHAAESQETPGSTDGRDDWAAWARAVSGDAASAAALVRTLGRLGLRLAQPMLHSSAAAEDAVQESLLRLWRSPPQDRGTARLSSYFATIVLNVCRDQWALSRRETSTDPELLTAWQDGAAPEGIGSSWATVEASDPGAQLDARSSERQLADAVASLPPRQRLAISLWAYADASTTDIARALELDTNATHQLLHRAKQALRQRLAGSSQS